jgi:alkanesulfonate monooxygenase SsuD/methylene tetrahydromethanopterin reductase-like flavin-dependent oxidoreductase (luciferase family)
LAGSVIAPHVPLSVLDLAPVGEGSSPAAALQASLVLAREAERFRYTRYWVAEAFSACRSPFAHHFAAGNTLPALAAYREAFRPSEHLDEPHVMLGVSVMCAETDEEARWLAGPSALAFLRLRSGRPGRYPTPEEAAEYNFTPQEREVVKAWTGSHVVGSPETVLRRLAELVHHTDADELMITTMTHGPAARLRSYRLVAEAAGLTPARGDGPLLEDRAVG